MASKQIAILGLSVFGSTLAETLENYGVEVLAIDIDPVCVERVADNVTRAVVADVTDKDQLLELGINDFDTAVVAISKKFEESVLATMILKEAGVENVLVEARTKRKKMILEKVGATRVINVEKEMAYKVSKSLLRRNIVDLVELDDEYSIVEIKAKASWVSRSLKDLDVRRRYGISRESSNKMNMNFSADYVVSIDDHFVVAARTEDVEKWDNLTK